MFTSVPESQISVKFDLQTAIFETQAILRQVHQITPKWAWTLARQRYPINVYMYVILVFPSSKI